MCKQVKFRMVPAMHLYPILYTSQQRKGQLLNKIMENNRKVSIKIWVGNITNINLKTYGFREPLIDIFKVL